MCKLYYYVQTTCYTASVAILTVISLERYVAIIHPMHTRRLHDIRLLVGVVVCVWITAAVSGLHYLVIFDTRQVSGAAGNIVHFCLIVNDFDPHLYNVISFAVWYAGPLIVMAVVYIRISFELWKSSSIISSSNSVSDRTTNIELQTGSTAVNTSEIEAVGDSAAESLHEIQSVTPQQRRRRCHVLATTGGSTRLTNNAELVRGRRKVIRLLVAVVASFAICVLPYHVRVMWQTFADPHVIDDWHLVIPPLTFVIYYLNSAVNPLLYAFLSDRFRSSFVDVLRGRCSQRSQTTTAVTRCATARSVRTTPL